MTVEDLLALAGASLDVVSIAVGADPGARESVTGYESLKRVDLLVGSDGARVFLRGEDVALIYIGEDSLPQGVDHDALVAELGTDGAELRSRQGKSALMHVVADKGVAWSEDGGHVGFLEIFPPTTLKEYQKRIYRKPAKFIR